MVKLGLNPGITTYAILLLSKEEIRCLKRNPLHRPILSVPSAKYNQHLTTSRHLYRYPTVLKVTITLCLDYSPYLPSGLPASSLTPLQSVFCSQSRPLKPSQIDHLLERVDIVTVPNPSTTPSCKCLHHPPCPVSDGTFRREEHTPRRQPWPAECEHR